MVFPLLFFCLGRSVVRTWQSMGLKPSTCWIMLHLKLARAYVRLPIYSEEKVTSASFVGDLIHAKTPYTLQNIKD